MNYIKNILVILFLLLTFTTLYSAEVSMSFGEKIPPYTFPETNSGLELEIISEALAYKGHTLKPQYYPLARVPIAFKLKWVDATMTDLGEDLSQVGGHYGNPAVWYNNIFFTLKQRNLSITKPEDLKGLTVISFQGAIKRYPKWLESVHKEGNYYEQNNQMLQVLALDKKRADVILSDRKIFKYFTLLLKREVGLEPKEVQEHEFVKLNLMDYRPIFRNKQIRDDFNEGLKHIKKTGRYQAIYDKYLKE